MTILYTKVLRSTAIPQKIALLLSTLFASP